MFNWRNQLKREAQCEKSSKKAVENEKMWQLFRKISVQDNINSICNNVALQHAWLKSSGARTLGANEPVRFVWLLLTTFSTAFVAFVNDISITIVVFFWRNFDVFVVLFDNISTTCVAFVDDILAVFVPLVDDISTANLIYLKELAGHPWHSCQQSRHSANSHKYLW